MNIPLISVILPVYNGDKYLNESIRSVINQDFKNFELIIVDGNSVDSTVEIAKKFSESQIIYQDNQGISDAFNSGIKKAKGKFIAFQSCDDIWTENKLKLQLNFLQNNSDIQYTTSKFKYFKEDNEPIPTGFKEELLEKELNGQTLETFFGRKKLFNEVGLFDTEFSSALDVEWFSRLNDMKIKNHRIDVVLLLKRLHSRNLSLNEKNNRYQILKALRKSINRKNKLHEIKQ